MALIYDEQFEATGYDETGGAETVTGGNTLDEDCDTTDAGSPANWDSQCLHAIAASGTSAFFTNSIDSSAQAIVYGRIDFIIHTHDSGVWNNFEIFRLCDASFNILCAVRIGGDGTNARKIYFDALYDDSSHIQVGDTFNLDTKYRVDFQWDTTNNTWEWKIDGTSKHSGTNLTSARVPKNIYCGIPTAYTVAADVYVDNLQLATDTWVPDDVEGGTGLQGTLSRLYRARRLVSGVSACTGTLGRLLHLKRSLAGQLGFTGSLEGQGPGGDLFPATVEGILGAIQGSLVAKVMAKESMGGLLQSLGAVSRKLSLHRSGTGVLNIDGLVSRRLALKRTPLGVLSLTGEAVGSYIHVGVKYFYSAAGSLTLGALLANRLQPAGSVSFGGTLSRRLLLRRSMGGVLTFQGTTGSEEEGGELGSLIFLGSRTSIFIG